MSSYTVVRVVAPSRVSAARLPAKRVDGVGDGIGTTDRSAASTNLVQPVFVLREAAQVEFVPEEGVDR